MCKAKNTISQILQLCEEADQYYNDQLKKLSTLDKTQDDVLHMIENDNFNAAEGYFYAKKLQEIRHERRIVKLEIETMLQFKPQMVDIIKQTKISQDKVIKREQKLTYLYENKIYKPKVLKSAI